MTTHDGTGTRIGRRPCPAEMERRRGPLSRDEAAAALLAAAAMAQPLWLTWQEWQAWERREGQR